MTEHLDRLDQIAACLRCLSDLLAPETDLHAVNRDDLACTIGFSPPSTRPPARPWTRLDPTPLNPRARCA